MGWFSHKYDPAPHEKKDSGNKRPRKTPREKPASKRKVWGIKKSMIEFIIEASKDSYPNEFYAKLLQKRGVISEFSIIRTIQGRTHAIPFTYMEPPDIFLETAGTIHSHPSGNNHPSSADLEFFSKMGDTHIIIGHPYTETTWRAYNRSGEPIELEVVRRVKR
jgi:proteasome lid subunit RPN8/RPN11